MRSVLDEIVEAKKVELERRKVEIPIEDLQKRIPEAPRPRNFCGAITKQPMRKVNLIAEIKKASPSAGVIRDDFDVAALAAAYAEAGADALSVLTDEQYFQGCLEYIHEAKQATSLPVLRKDFIVDEYQIYEARAYGADAILLIADVLEGDDLLELTMLTDMLGMTALIEVHSDQSLELVRQSVGLPLERYCLLGINNRDLHAQNTDINRTLQMMELLADDEKGVVVSESGIKTPADVDTLAEAGIRAVLIGETFMRAEDVGAKVAELLGPMPTEP